MWPFYLSKTHTDCSIVREPWKPIVALVGLVSTWFMSHPHWTVRKPGGEDVRETNAFTSHWFSIYIVFSNFVLWNLTVSLEWIASVCWEADICYSILIGQWSAFDIKHTSILQLFAYRDLRKEGSTFRLECCIADTKRHREIRQTQERQSRHLLSSETFLSWKDLD